MWVDYWGGPKGMLAPPSQIIGGAWPPLFLRLCKPNSSEEEDFLIFFMYFYGLNLGPPAPRPSWNLVPAFEQTW